MGESEKKKAKTNSKDLSPLFAVKKKNLQICVDYKDTYQICTTYKKLMVWYLPDFDFTDVGGLTITDFFCLSCSIQVVLTASGIAAVVELLVSISS